LIRGVKKGGETALFDRVDRVAALKAHLGKGSPFDDVTLMVVRKTP